MADRATADDQSNVFIFGKGKRRRETVGNHRDILAVINPSAISIVVLPLSRITVIPSWIILTAACAILFSARWRAEIAL